MGTFIFIALVDIRQQFIMFLGVSALGCCRQVSSYKDPPNYDRKYM